MSEAGDLLHPLATLQWEEATPLPKGGRYPQCFMLKDRLYMATTHKYSTMDMVHNLHRSTADLKTWVPLEVPSELFGIGVYCSEVVLVGGRETTTRRVTDKIWVSEDGTDWRASELPPMLSPRSLPSVASAEDPECLIVAGGADPHDRIKTVEVLLHRCQWVKVEPLPVACCKMQSLVWNGNVYFGLKGDPGREESSVFYCNLRALLSTVRAGPHERTPSGDSAPIWRELKTPVKEPAPHIFMNQLIVAGRTHFKTDPCSLQNQIVCAFSPRTQEWVQVGDMPYGISYPAIVALGAGKLVLLGEEDVGQWKTLKASLKSKKAKIKIVNVLLKRLGSWLHAVSQMVFFQEPK